MDINNRQKINGRMIGGLTGAVFLVLLFSFLFMLGGTKAHADDSDLPTIIRSCYYDPDADSIVAVQECYIYVLRRESGNIIKASTKYTPMFAGKSVTLTSLGKKSTSKDVYLLIVGSPIREKVTGVTASMKISAQKVRKFTPVIDYTLVNYDDGIVNGGCPWSFLSAELKDKSKAVITDYSLSWSEKINGTYYPVIGVYNDTTNAFEHTLDGEYLAAKVAKGATIYVKVRGTNTQTGTENVRTSKAYKVRIQKQQKAPTVVVDAAKEKIGLRNGMDFAIAYQNGGNGNMPVAYNDGYSITWDDKTFTGDQYVYKWYTILPYDRNASTKTQYETIVSGSRNGITAREGEIVNSVCRDNGTVGLYNIMGFYIPRDIKDDEALKDYTADGDSSVSFSSFNINGIDYWDVVPFAGSTDTTLVVRKSPSVKQPGSKNTTIKLTYYENAPMVYTESNVADEFIISTSDRLLFTMPKVVNSPYVMLTEEKRVGSVWKEANPAGGDPVDKNDYDKYKYDYRYNKKYFDTYYDFTEEKWINLNTTGFDTTFSAGAGADNIKSFYEYAIVSTEDYYYKDRQWTDNVDWSTVTWKRINSETGIVSEKLCTIYKNNDKQKKNVTLSAQSVTPTNENINLGVSISDASTIMLIRRAAYGTYPPSKWVCTYVVKVGEKYYWMSNVANGDYAYPYTIRFATYDKKTQKYVVDESLDITGYAKNNKEISFTCPDVGVLWTPAEGDLAPALTNMTNISKCESGKKATITTYMKAPASVDGTAPPANYYVQKASKIPVGSSYEAVICCDRCSDLTIYRSLQNKIDGMAFSLDESISLNTSPAGTFRTCQNSSCQDGAIHYFLANHKYEVTEEDFKGLNKPGFVIDLAASVDGEILTSEGSGAGVKYYLNVPDEPSTLTIRYNFDTVNIPLFTYMEKPDGSGEYTKSSVSIADLKTQKGFATVVGASMIPSYEGYEFRGIKTGSGLTDPNIVSELNGSYYVTTAEPADVYLQYDLCTYRASVKTDIARGGTYGMDVKNTDCQIIGCKYGVAKEVTESMLPVVENYLIDWPSTLANNSCLSQVGGRYYITLKAETTVTIYYKIQ